MYLRSRQTTPSEGARTTAPSVANGSLEGAHLPCHRYTRQVLRPSITIIETLYSDPNNRFSSAESGKTRPKTTSSPTLPRSARSPTPPCCTTHSLEGTAASPSSPSTTSPPPKSCVPRDTTRLAARRPRPSGRSSRRRPGTPPPPTPPLRCRPFQGDAAGWVTRSDKSTSRLHHRLLH